jgi:Ser/Thr protein kinase RdoA (MazF antagonist)
MAATFPTLYSTLAPAALAAMITERYGFADVVCTLLLCGVGDTYTVHTADNMFILRAYRTTHRSKPQVAEEMALLLALKAAAVPVSYPVASQDGEVIQIVDAAEGVRCVVLFSYAPGASVSKLSTPQLLTLGRGMACMHNVSAQMKPGGSRWYYDLATTLHQPLTTLQPYFGAESEEYQWLQDETQRIIAAIAQLDTASFSAGLCHYDMLPKNFHFNGDALTFFDFDFMGYGWLIHDIMTFRQHLLLEVHFGRSTQEAADNDYAVFLSGYTEVRSLSKDELAAVPLLGLGFWLFYSAFHTTHPQFYPFIQQSHLRARFGFVRQIIERSRM